MLTARKSVLPGISLYIKAKNSLKHECTVPPTVMHGAKSGGVGMYERNRLDV